MSLTRLFDVITSSLLLVLLSPFLLYRAVAAYRQTKAVFVSEPRLGYQQRLFKRLNFSGTGAGKELALLINVLRGDLAWAGTRALTPDEAAQLPGATLRHFDITPGVVSAKNAL